MEKRYKAFLGDVLKELNTDPTPIRELTLKDFPTVDFYSLHRTGQTPKQAAYIALMITQHSITDQIPTKTPPTKAPAKARA
ncbi:MAG: hypothetical protein LBR76_01810 [Oscillospiraceae bacterium]|jgi:hypothetical protein|nr:hypothetical protein [Oscillospiraceae bacterium]